ARAGNRRRRALERRLAERPRREETEGAWQHLWPGGDAELTRLPEHYRAPIVLCDLEGLSLREAARQPGRPLRTVASGLGGGRSLRARRVSRRGLALPGGLLASVLCGHAAAGVPAPLMGCVVSVSASVRAAALSEGVLRSMCCTRLEVAVTFLLL